MQRHYQVIFEALLSVLVMIDLLLLGLMTVGFFVGIKSSSVFTFGIFDLVIIFFILLDFLFFRLKKQEGMDAWQYLRENWAFLLAIIPFTFIFYSIFNLYGFNAIFIVFGIIRIIALIKVLTICTRNVREYPSKTKLDYATFVLLLVLIIGSYLFFLVETGVNPEVPSFESAMWYSIVSMTTVGYGDIVPVTFTGRIIGIIIILTGMGYLSLVTATLAFSFIELFRAQSRKAVEKLEKRILGYEEKIDKLLEKVEKIEKKVDQLEKIPKK